MTDVTPAAAADSAGTAAQATPNITVNVTTPGPAALPPKSVGVAYVLWVFLGVLGVHRFYIGKIGTGILWLLTGGLFGIGWIVDAFTLASQVRRVNQMRAAGIG